MQNTKNRKILIILVLAMVLAGGAVFFTIKLLSPVMDQVYVFKDAYTAGTQIDESMLLAVDCDQNILEAQKKTTANEVFVTKSNLKEVLTNGEQLRYDVTAGTPLMKSMLSVAGGSSIEMTMDSTKVAVTIPITNITGVTNELTTGSRVNIYATGLSEGSETTLLFQGVKLLAINKNSSDELTGVTLEVTTEESLKLVNATTRSSLYLSLINSSGYVALPDDSTYSYTGSDTYVTEEK